MKIFHEVKGIPELEEKKQEGEDRIEMPEAAKTGDEVQPVKTAEETNAENSQNQQKLEEKRRMKHRQTKHRNRQKL